ncbi:hypothetical protein C8R44DRAFT_546620, partial [Mycena epipterygia]
GNGGRPPGRDGSDRNGRQGIDRRSSRETGGRPPGPPGPPPGDDLDNGLEDRPSGPRPPYGTVVPTIDPKVKVSSLSGWDGNKDTAVDYFWDVQQFATLEGWLPGALGFWLPSRFEKGSAVQTWFSMLPTRKQAEMRKHYLIFLRVIKERFLGRKWQIFMNLEFEQQKFRQEGHGNESPQEFLGRRVRATRMLANMDDGGPLEVFIVMRAAPLRWSTILVLENIQSIEELYDKVNEHDDSLVDAARSEHGSSISTQSLASALRRLGIPLDSLKSNFHKRANLATVEGGNENDNTEDAFDLNVAENESSNTEEGTTLKEVYNTFKKRQREPPKGEYPFPCNDHVTTKMGKAPLCGRNLQSGTDILVMDTSSLEDLNISGNKIEYEYWAEAALKPKARNYILEREDEDLGDEVSKKIPRDAESHSVREEDSTESITHMPPPPTEVEIIRLNKRRNPQQGESAIGVSVLSIRGWVDSTENKTIDLRLDSGADISLISEEFHSSLKKPPRIHQGHHMSLSQLTDVGTVIKGYTKLKIFMKSTNDELLEMEAEAYVVKGMSVPILLGEDFQLTYEIGVTRNIESGTKILFHGQSYKVAASGVTPQVDANAMRALATGLTVHSSKMMKAKEHRRRKTQRQRKERRWEREELLPHSCKVVRLDGNFKEDREWMIERLLLADAHDSFFLIPNTLISARNPMLPITNTSERPRFIRKGEILGSLANPQKFFDSPKDE